MNKDRFSIRSPQDGETGKYVLLLGRPGNPMFGGGGMVTFVVESLDRFAGDFIAKGADNQIKVQFSKDTPYILVQRDLFEQFSEIDEYRRHVEDQMEILNVRAELEPALRARTKEVNKLDEPGTADDIQVELSHPGRYA